MNKKLHVGIIGCGGIANAKHLPSLKATGRVELAAFCDIIPERAEKTAREYGAADAKVYTDYQALLRDPSIDVVHVCTPNKSHAQISIDALHAGKHVMCEKPMAKTAADARRMVAAAKETGKKLTIGYQYRQKPESAYLKKVIDHGDLGDIYFAEAYAVRRRGTPTWGVFLNEEEQGGGPLIDIGTHSLDLTLWLMGYRAGLGGENPIFAALPPAERAAEGPLLARPDYDNQFGDSMLGYWQDWSFAYTIPGESLRWIGEDVFPQEYFFNGRGYSSTGVQLDWLRDLEHIPAWVECEIPMEQSGVRALF